MAKMPNRKMKFKLNVVILGFLTICFFILSIRIIYIACFAKINGVKYGVKARNRQMSAVTIRPSRGTIYDRNMVPLAQNATVWTVSVSPNQFKSEEQKEKVVNHLCDMLEVENKEKIFKRCTTSKRKYEIVQKNVEKSKRDEVLEYIKKNKLVGAVNTEEDTKRYYPLGRLASHTIGFVGADNQGLIGLELFYNKVLSGTPGRVVRVQDALGGPMPYDYENKEPAKDGNGIVVSLDSVVQRICSNAVIDLHKWNLVSDRCGVIIMNVENGEIIAMALHPEFDLNEPFILPDAFNFPAIKDKPEKEAREINWRNKFVSDTYEPGSVFKVVTASAALEEKVASLDSTFSCNGGINVQNRYIKCWKSGGGHGTQNFIQIIVNSCNPGFVQLGLKIGPKLFTKYLELFGITKKTNIDLPGEASPIYYKAKNLTPISLASESFGQSLSITPIQMLNAFAAVVNGGYLQTPHLLKQVLDADGNVIRTNIKKPRRQAISRETSAIMRKALIEVVKGPNGTGTNSSVPGYLIGGKTGTGQDLSFKQATGKEKYVSSFASFLVGDNPKYGTLVLAYGPGTSHYYGSEVASPTAAKITSKIAPYFGFAQSYPDKEFLKYFAKVPPVEGMLLDDAKTKLEQAGLENIKFIGKGERVLTQLPTPSVNINKNSIIYCYTDMDDIEKNTVKVPDILGCNQSQAKEILNNCGINMTVENVAIRPNSKATAIAQSPEPDSLVVRGYPVEVTFQMDDGTG